MCFWGLFVLLVLPFVLSVVCVDTFTRRSRPLPSSLSVMVRWVWPVSVAWAGKFWCTASSSLHALWERIRQVTEGRHIHHLAARGITCGQIQEYCAVQLDFSSVGSHQSLVQDAYQVWSDATRPSRALCEGLRLGRAVVWLCGMGACNPGSYGLGG